MANFFGRNNTENALPARQQLEAKYNSARANLLLVVAFTVINIVLLVLNSSTYFLFSAFIPYFIAGLGMLFCGKYPSEYYDSDFSGMEFLGNSAFVVFIAIAVIITLLYLLGWLLSKNLKVGWLIFSLVFFSIDTLGLLAISEIGADSIIDIVFHVWVIVSLSSGIAAYNKLKKLGDEPELEQGTDFAQQDEITDTANVNTIARRLADTEVKSRVLAEAEAFGRQITYRRVKRVNELVIDGYVYSEMEALIETAHTLTAELDGHTIVAGYDGKMYSYIEVDGERIAKKIRLY